MPQQLRVQAPAGDDGATAVEYGLMLSLIFLVIIAAVTLLGLNLLGVFNAIAAAI